MPHEIDSVLAVTPNCRRLHGRRRIFTGAQEITGANVVNVLGKALPTHNINRAEIQYLYDYLRGEQPILYRSKKVNDDICNKIVVNRANEIITFKTANFIGEPLQYVSRGTKPETPENIETLNSMMLSESKHSKDMELAYWIFTAGLGYRLVLRDKMLPWMEREIYDEAPFEIYTLDPRNTFVVYSNNVAQRPVMAVTYVFSDDVRQYPVYTCYTKDAVYTVTGAGELQTVNEQRHNFGIIPIVEYPCNPLRMGAFEVVLDLLDAINATESNRLDGVEQFIQGMLVFQGVDITQEMIQQARELKAIQIPPKMDGTSAGQSVYYLNEQLDQSQTQTLADNFYDELLQIVGMPSQGLANTSDSSNNGAVIMKNGWWNAEARAKETEGMWKQAETDFLKIVLRICREAGAFDMSVSDIQLKFLRRSYEDKMTKVQSFAQLIASGAPPLQAYQISEVVPDSESAALSFEQYKDAQDDELAEFVVKAGNAEKAEINAGAESDVQNEEA